MRHRMNRRKLGRNTSHRAATLRSLVVNLFLTQPAEDGSSYERIVTTPQKAKEARRMAERIITLGKKGTLAARRRALALLDNKQAVKKVFETIGPRYANRPGGYTRILGHPSNRLGDNARQVFFELVEPYEGGGTVAAEKPEVAAETALETAETTE